MFFFNEIDNFVQIKNYSKPNSYSILESEQTTSTTSIIPNTNFIEILEIENITLTAAEPTDDINSQASLNFGITRCKSETISDQPCTPPKIDWEYKRIRRHLYIILLSISVVSLFVSLLLHLIVVELKSTTFGYLKISHLSATLGAFSVLLTIYVGGADLVLHHNVLCKMLGHASQFFFLASFLWVNVMSFDMWLTFRSLRRKVSIISYSMIFF